MQRLLRHIYVTYSLVTPETNFIMLLSFNFDILV